MKPEDLLAQLNTYNMDYFMNEALSRVPPNIDIREGSIIYDALAPACLLLTEMSQNISNVLINTYTQTATGVFLDYRAAEKGLARESATFSLVTATFKDTNNQVFNPDIGTRFSSIGTEPVYYDVTKKIMDGQFTLTAEISGNSGNRYVGQILPVDNISGLGYAEITEVTIPARDEETDDDLRSRILESYELTEYGGNVQDYISMVENLGNVGAAQVYPTWNGGGTVRVVVLDNQFNVPSEALVAEVQEALDPNPQGDGYGLAPIGHTVTVAAPTAKSVDVSFTLTTESDMTVTDITPEITEKLQEYFLNLRTKEWAMVQNYQGYALTVYISQITAAIMSIEGVINVSELTLNGLEEDVVLKLDNELQEVPVLGKVIVNG